MNVLSPVRPEQGATTRTMVPFAARSVSVRWSELATDAYFLFVACVIALYSMFLTRWSPNWVLGDWLINYQGGFVRRGLPGEVLYQLGRVLHIGPQHFLLPLTLGLYAGLLLAFRALLQRASQSPWVLAIFLSPATLSFPVLDSEAGFHKELLFLALFAVFLLLLQRGRLSPLGAGVYMTVALVITTLSHESLIFYAPYLVAALVVAGWGLGRTVRVSLVPLLLGGAAAYACSRHLGSYETAAQICSSLGFPFHPDHQGLGYCDDGSITYLRYTRFMARIGTLDTIHKFSYVRFYSALLPLALLPLAAGGWALARSGFRREIRVLLVAFVLSALASVVLFVYAVDWGRWIYIHVFCLGLLLIMLDGRARAGERANSRPVQAQRSKWITGALLALYGTTWSLPHFHTSPFRAGYVGMARFALFGHHSMRHPPLKRGSL